LSLGRLVDTLNRQGHKFSFKQVPKEVFAALFPGAAEIAETLSYFQAYTYLGSDSYDQLWSENLWMHIPAEVRRDAKHKDQPPQYQRRPHPNPVILHAQALGKNGRACRYHKV